MKVEPCPGCGAYALAAVDGQLGITCQACGHHLETERAQATPVAVVVVRRVADRVPFPVRQRHVTDTTLVEMTEVFQILTDRRAVLQAHRQRDQARREVGANIGRRASKREDP